MSIESFEDTNAMVSMLKMLMKPSYTPVSLDSEKDAMLKQEKSSAKVDDAIETSSESSGDTVYEESPSIPEREHGPVNARIVSDAIIGLSDGLTVPFALTAGLSALGDTKVVVFGGLAELIAGAISMGLGGYLGAKSEEAAYNATHRSTRTQVLESSSSLSAEITSIFAPYHLPPSLLKDFTHQLITSNTPDTAVDFLMHFQHRTPEPVASRAITCALTIALGYFVGGFIPLLPYFFASQVTEGLIWSISVMILALFVFGYVKTGFVEGWRGSRCVKNSLWGAGQMVIIGGSAAGCAMGVVRLFSAIQG
ncbi:Protein ccc1 [Cladophialophora chaetospira]|uniref:Protein ccc1 n=1 Tax=Cladophialophora chaetospira TaxID=386627 RepID=A0AA39CDA5_9EURO|nr:Protein ccc1 [Cladophialophora chaetospira]